MIEDNVHTAQREVCHFTGFVKTFLINYEVKKIKNMDASYTIRSIPCMQKTEPTDPPPVKKKKKRNQNA